jgi:fatty acid/phospholipid biosynthesis enzyme
MAMAGTDRIAVDALGGDPLPLAALQGLVDAYNQRISFGHEGFHEQP